jgi:hypothetical protein
MALHRSRLANPFGKPLQIGPAIAIVLKRFTRWRLRQSTTSDAVVRSLEALAQKRRTRAHCREDERSYAPIEYAFGLRDQTYAIEHTVVEAFAGQINSDRRL